MYSVCSYYYPDQQVVELILMKGGIKIPSGQEFGLSINNGKIFSIMTLENGALTIESPCLPDRVTIYQKNGRKWLLVMHITEFLL